MSVTSSEIILSSYSSPFFSGRTPVPPGVNHQYQIVEMEDGRHRLADTKEYRQYKEDADHTLDLAFCDLKVVEAIRNSKKEHVPLLVTIRFYFRELWRRDVDGCVKAVVDAAFRSMGLKDNLVVQLRVTKELDKKDPRAEIDVACVLSPVK